MDVKSLEEKSFIAAEYNVTNCFKQTQETVQNLISQYDRSHSMMTTANKREKIVYFDDESQFGEVREPFMVNKEAPALAVGYVGKQRDPR